MLLLFYALSSVVARSYCIACTDMTTSCDGGTILDPNKVNLDDFFTALPDQSIFLNFSSCKTTFSINAFAEKTVFLNSIVPTNILGESNSQISILSNSKPSSARFTVYDNIELSLIGQDIGFNADFFNFSSLKSSLKVEVKQFYVKTVILNENFKEFKEIFIDNGYSEYDLILENCNLNEIVIHENQSITINQNTVIYFLSINKRRKVKIKPNSSSIINIKSFLNSNTKTTKKVSYNNEIHDEFTDETNNLHIQKKSSKEAAKKSDFRNETNLEEIDDLEDIFEINNLEFEIINASQLTFSGVFNESLSFHLFNCTTIKLDTEYIQMSIFDSSNADLILTSPKSIISGSISPTFSLNVEHTNDQTNILRFNLWIKGSVFNSFNIKNSFIDLEIDDLDVKNPQSIKFCVGKGGISTLKATTSIESLHFSIINLNRDFDSYLDDNSMASFIFQRIFFISLRTADSIFFPKKEFIYPIINFIDKSYIHGFYFTDSILSIEFFNNTQELLYAMNFESPNKKPLELCYSQAPIIDCNGTNSVELNDLANLLENWIFEGIEVVEISLFHQVDLIDFSHFPKNIKVTIKNMNSNKSRIFSMKFDAQNSIKELNLIDVEINSCIFSVSNTLSIYKTKINGNVSLYNKVNNLIIDESLAFMNSKALFTNADDVQFDSPLLSNYKLYFHNESIVLVDVSSQEYPNENDDNSLFNSGSVSNYISHIPYHDNLTINLNFANNNNKTLLLNLMNSNYQFHDHVTMKMNLDNEDENHNILIDTSANKYKDSKPFIIIHHGDIDVDLVYDFVNSINIPHENILSFIGFGEIRKNYRFSNGTTKICLYNEKNHNKDEATDDDDSNDQGDKDDELYCGEGFINVKYSLFESIMKSTNTDSEIIVSVIETTDDNYPVIDLSAMHNKNIKLIGNSTQQRLGLLFNTNFLNNPKITLTSELITFVYISNSDDQYKENNDKLENSLFIDEFIGYNTEFLYFSSTNITFNYVECSYSMFQFFNTVRINSHAKVIVDSLINLNDINFEIVFETNDFSIIVENSSSSIIIGDNSININNAIFTVKKYTENDKVIIQIPKNTNVQCENPENSKFCVFLESEEENPSVSFQGKFTQSNKFVLNKLKNPSIYIHDTPILCCSIISKSNDLSIISKVYNLDIFGNFFFSFSKTSNLYISYQNDPNSDNALKSNYNKKSDSLHEVHLNGCIMGNSNVHITFNQPNITFIVDTILLDKIDSTLAVHSFLSLEGFSNFELRNKTIQISQFNPIIRVNCPIDEAINSNKVLDFLTKEEVLIKLPFKLPRQILTFSRSPETHGLKSSVFISQNPNYEIVFAVFRNPLEEPVRICYNLPGECDIEINNDTFLYDIRSLIPPNVTQFDFEFGIGNPPEFPINFDYDEFNGATITMFCRTQEIAHFKVGFNRINELYLSDCNIKFSDEEDYSIDKVIIGVASSIEGNANGVKVIDFAYFSDYHNIKSFNNKIILNYDGDSITFERTGINIGNLIIESNRYKEILLCFTSEGPKTINIGPNILEIPSFIHLSLNKSNKVILKNWCEMTKASNLLISSPFSKTISLKVTEFPIYTLPEISSENDRMIIIDESILPLKIRKFDFFNDELLFDVSNYSLNGSDFAVLISLVEMSGSSEIETSKTGQLKIDNLKINDGSNIRVNNAKIGSLLSISGNSSLNGHFSFDETLKIEFRFSLNVLPSILFPMFPDSIPSKITIVNDTSSTDESIKEISENDHHFDAYPTCTCHAEHQFIPYHEANIGLNENSINETEKNNRTFILANIGLNCLYWQKNIELVGFESEIYNYSIHCNDGFLTMEQFISVIDIPDEITPNIESPPTPIFTLPGHEHEPIPTGESYKMRGLSITAITGIISSSICALLIIIVLVVVITLKQKYKKRIQNSTEISIEHVEAELEESYIEDGTTIL